MYLTKEHHRIVNEDTATAYLVSKTKNSWSIGFAIPPPPIPAMLHKAITIAKAKSPKYSIN